MIDTGEGPERCLQVMPRLFEVPGLIRQTIVSLKLVE
jgi:hypothetical protein